MALIRIFVILLIVSLASCTTLDKNYVESNANWFNSNGERVKNYTEKDEEMSPLEKKAFNNHLNEMIEFNNQVLESYQK